MFTNKKYVYYGSGRIINFIKIVLFNKMHNKICTNLSASSAFVYWMTMQMNLINPSYKIFR